MRHFPCRHCRTSSPTRILSPSGTSRPKCTRSRKFDGPAWRRAEAEASGGEARGQSATSSQGVVCAWARAWRGAPQCAVRWVPGESREKKWEPAEVNAALGPRSYDGFPAATTRAAVAVRTVDDRVELRSRRDEPRRLRARRAVRDVTPAACEGARARWCHAGRSPPAWRVPWGYAASLLRRTARRPSCRRRRRATGTSGTGLRTKRSGA